MRNPPLYSMKPSFLNLFRKKLTRDRVVPTISARVSWLIFGMIVPPSCLSFPKWASNKESEPVAFHWN